MNENPMLDDVRALKQFIEDWSLEKRMLFKIVTKADEDGDIVGLSAIWTIPQDEIDDEEERVFIVREFDHE